MTDVDCTCVRRASHAHQIDTMRTLEKHHVAAKRAPRAHQTSIVHTQHSHTPGHAHARTSGHMWSYEVGANERWGFLWNIIINYLNIQLCLLKGVWCFLHTSWEWPIMLFKGEGRVGDSRGHQGQALVKPNEHHDTALGVPRTLRWHSNTHTWVPRHVWCASRGRNCTGPGAAYIFPVLSRGHLKACAVNQLEKLWAQCHHTSGH